MLLYLQYYVQIMRDKDKAFVIYFLKSKWMEMWMKLADKIWMKQFETCSKKFNLALSSFSFLGIRFKFNESI